MLPVGGKPMLQHQLELLKKYGITKIIINLHHLPDFVTNYFGDGKRFGVNIEYSNEPELLGTAGGIKHAEALLSDPFLVMFADNLTDMNISEVVAYHYCHRGAGTITVYPSESPETMGVVLTDPYDTITQFLEKHPNPPTNEVSAGVCIFDKSILKHVPKATPYDLGSQLYPDLLKKGVILKRFNPKAYVQDTGTPERYEKAQKDYEEWRKK